MIIEIINIDTTKGLNLISNTNRKIICCLNEIFIGFFIKQCCKLPYRKQTLNSSYLIHCPNRLNLQIECR